MQTVRFFKIETFSMRGFSGPCRTTRSEIRDTGHESGPIKVYLSTFDVIQIGSNHDGNSNEEHQTLLNCLLFTVFLFVNPR